MRSRVALALLLGLAVIAAGCILITGGTGGYTLAGGAEGGTCESAAECDAGGGQPQICCLSLASGAACQVGPCGAQKVQLCAKSAECDDAACVPQSCMLDGVQLGLRACGVIPLLCTED
jgi:hypothetical protein